MRTATPFVLMLAAAFAAPALAQQEDDVEILEQSGTEVESGRASEPGRGVYSSVGITQVKPDFENLDEAINLDAVIGFHVPAVNWLKAEINLSQTIVPGANSGVPPGGTSGTTCNPLDELLGLCTPSSGSSGGGGSNFTQSPNHLQLFSAAVFAVAKSPGDFYGLARAGYRFINSTIPEINEGDASGAAYGAGIGYRIGSDAGVELIYTRFSSQLDYLTLNIAYGLDN